MKSYLKTNRLNVWGNSECGKKSSIRKRRLREASKKRRVLLKKTV